MDLRHDRALAFAPAPSLTPHTRYGEATVPVKEFFFRLRRVPLAEWLKCAEGRPCLEPALADVDVVPSLAQLQDAQRDEAARVRLTEIMESMPNVVRRIRQRIDADLAVAERIAPRAAVAAMRRVAGVAACAVAARPHLTPDEFERLYSPFVAQISPADLQTS